MIDKISVTCLSGEYTTCVLALSTLTKEGDKQPTLEHSVLVCSVLPLWLCVKDIGSYMRVSENSTMDPAPATR